MRTHLLALATWLATFLLVLLGGVVHATGSSLACPDWPTCFGSFFPEMVGGVVYEHGHRILGTLVGALALLLAFALRRPAGWAVVALVIVQGVLGGLTVIFRLPIEISTLHLALSQAILVLLAWLVLDTHPTWRGTQIRKGPLAIALLVYLQLISGALVRHSGSGLACGIEFPLCHGAWLPVDRFGWLQMVHRALAVPIVVGVLALARRGGVLPVGAAVIVAAQFTLGVASVYSLLGVEVVTAHLGTGALLLNVLAVQALGLAAPARGRSLHGVRLPVPG